MGHWKEKCVADLTVRRNLFSREQPRVEETLIASDHSHGELGEAANGQIFIRCLIRDANAVDTELFSLGVGARWAEISAPVFLSTADDGWCNSICSKGPRIGAGPAAFCHQVMPLALAY